MHTGAFIRRIYNLLWTDKKPCVFMGDERIFSCFVYRVSFIFRIDRYDYNLIDYTGLKNLLYSSAKVLIFLYCYHILIKSGITKQLSHLIFLIMRVTIYLPTALCGLSQETACLHYCRFSMSFLDKKWEQHFFAKASGILFYFGYREKKLFSNFDL